MRKTVLLLLAFAAAASGADAPPLFQGMGGHHRKVSTESDLAQRYFDQGLVWAFAFNHDEAIRSFTEAARLDPALAMAYWGIAYCHGPHINYPMVPEERAKAAWAALQEALARREKASPVERALIDALAKRYAYPQPEDRRPLDEAYAEAMRSVWLAHPDDADVAHLYAEALMDLQPWDLWTKDGAPKGKTEEIVAVLEAGLRCDPHHPGLHHLYIHAQEAGPTPHRGVWSADYLRDAVPAAGHLVHMPGHIYVQVGRWADASLANERAMEADARYRKIVPRTGLWRLYMMHNDHFLAFANMMQGRSDETLAAARSAIDGIPEDYLRENAPFVDPYMPIYIEALMRFGRWDDVLAHEEPAADLPITRAKWRFARAVSYAAKGDVEAARAEQKRFSEAVARVPADAMMVLSPAHDVLRIADHMLEGELLFRENRIDESVAALRQAVALEDALPYMEPPEWIQPVRHTLGAVLARAGRVEEAEAVYRKDLEVWPENGWSLFGLWKCLERRGEKHAAASVKARFDKVWAKADLEICATCLCVPSME